MDKVIIICVLIGIGLFVVFMINNNANKPQPVSENVLNVPSLSPSPSMAQVSNATPSQTPSSKTDNISNSTTAVIRTERGDISITLFPKEAPNTVNNFLQKAKSGFYKNLIFHRVEDWVIQGGDPDGNGTGGGNMKVEFNNKPFIVGALGVASRGDNVTQNDAQFFIAKTDAQFLNGKYTNFGQVTKGMDVVNAIEIGDKILDIQLVP